MEKLLTTTELALAIGASESSMRRWTNSGVIRTARTAGGHRRIALSEAIRFIRESGTTVVRPEVLGLPNLPADPGILALSGDSLPGQFYEALRSGDAQAALGCISGLFLNGLSIAAICDGSIQPAMHRLGELWREDPRGILVEHRATDICVSALGVLRQMIGDPPKNAPIALGGAPQGDPYLLPSMIAGAVFAETGYRDMNFGPDTPLDLLATAAEEKKPRIVWLSIKSAGDRAKIRTQVGELAERLAGMGINLVIGGSAVESLNLRSGRNIHIMQTMTELGAFARGASGVTTQPNPDSEK